MRKRQPLIKLTEETRTRKVLSIREKQFGIATAALRRILSFESAIDSVFVTEVDQLKLWALNALRDMENLQRPPKKRLMEPDVEVFGGLGIQKTARKIEPFKRGGRR